MSTPYLALSDSGFIPLIRLGKGPQKRAFPAGTALVFKVRSLELLRGGDVELKAVRGMHDLFGIEIAKWTYVEEKVRAILAHHGYQEIRTPVLERREVFSQTVGDETDIVEKQMYTIQGDGQGSENEKMHRCCSSFGVGFAIGSGSSSGATNSFLLRKHFLQHRKQSPKDCTGQKNFSGNTKSS